MATAAIGLIHIQHVHLLYVCESSVCHHAAAHKLKNAYLGVADAARCLRVPPRHPDLGPDLGPSSPMNCMTLESKNEPTRFISPCWFFVAGAPIATACVCSRVCSSCATASA